MPPETLIRDATPRDAVALARIHLIARAAAMPWLAKVHSDEQTLAWMAATKIKGRIPTKIKGRIPFPVGQR